MIAVGFSLDPLKPMNLLLFFNCVSFLYILNINLLLIIFKLSTFFHELFFNVKCLSKNSFEYFITSKPLSGS